MRNRRSGQQLSSSGSAQSFATGVLTVLAAERVVEDGIDRAVSMAEVVTLAEATSRLDAATRVRGR